MAKLSERLPDNAPGEFYVDRTSIDCDTCTRIAPGLFAGADDHSYVARQPETENDRLRALALVSCPTASIGTVSRVNRRFACGRVLHAVLLYRDRFLFTGDHLAWSPERRRLYAFRDACWHSWTEQIRSMERLLDYRFEWILPGHGRWWHAPSSAAMRTELERCIAWMRE